MANNRVIVPLDRLVRRGTHCLRKFKNKYPEYEDDIVDDNEEVNNGIRDFVIARLYNIVVDKSKYEINDFDDVSCLASIIRHYVPDPWYRDCDKELVISHPPSFDFNNDWVDVMDSFISEYCRNAGLSVRWELIALDVRKTTLLIEIYGDWRAKEYCKAEGIEYEPC